jgi:hypothetical protein
MRTAVLLDEAAEGVDFCADPNAGDVIARQRERRFERPGAGRRIEHLVEIAVHPVARVASDNVNVSHAFDHRVLAHRDRQARLLDPAAAVRRLPCDARHVALLFDARRDGGDGAVVETDKERIARSVGRIHPCLTRRSRERRRR